MNFNYKIIEVCIKQAKCLLEEFKEFYPFAFAMDKNLDIVSVMTYNGDECPSSNTVISELEKVLEISNDKNHYIGVAICSNVKYSNPNSANKKDALQIKVDFLDGPTINFYEIYKISNDGFLIEDEILEAGSLLFFNK